MVRERHDSTQTNDNRCRNKENCNSTLMLSLRSIIRHGFNRLEIIDLIDLIDLIALIALIDGQ